MTRDLIDITAFGELRARHLLVTDRDVWPVDEWCDWEWIETRI